MKDLKLRIRIENLRLGAKGLKLELDTKDKEKKESYSILNSFEFIYRQIPTFIF